MESRIRILVDSCFPYDVNAPGLAIVRIDGRGASAVWRKYLPQSLKLYLSSFRCDIIMTCRKYGKLLGILYSIYKPARLKHVIYEFIFDIRGSWRGKISRAVWKYTIKKIDRVFVQSSSEIRWYSKVFGVSDGKFRFLPVAVNTDQAYVGPTDGGYIFSGGRTNRDYGILIMALRELDVPGVVVAGGLDRDLLADPPPRTRVYSDLVKENFCRLLAGSRLVVVPLKPGFSSRGQVVLLEAMALGKPVICTDVPSVRDYVEDGVNCRLVPPGNKSALKEAIRRFLEDGTDLDQFGRKGYETARNLFSQERFMVDFKSAVHEILRN